MATPPKLPSETAYGDVERGVFRPPVKKATPMTPPKEFTAIDIPMTKNLSDTLAVRKIADRWRLPEIRAATVTSGKRRRVSRKKTSKRSTRRRK